MIKMIALDLGGVIITMDNDEPVRRFKELGIKDVEHMLDPYVQSGLFGDLEQGKISEEQFRKELSRYAGKELTWEECQYGWKGYVKEVPQYNLDAMLKLRNMGFALYWHRTQMDSCRHGPTRRNFLRTDTLSAITAMPCIGVMKCTR